MRRFERCEIAMVLHVRRIGYGNKTGFKFVERMMGGKATAVRDVGYKLLNLQSYM